MAKQNHESLFKYHLTNFAGGVKKVTQSKFMVSIVNGFINCMPIIIAASIFTLLCALPTMLISVVNENSSILTNPVYEEFQNWGSNISNWSMGILGMCVTAAIAKNLCTILNQKLPFEKKVNETIVIFAALSCYLMLSVVTFVVDTTVEPVPSWIPLDKSGRAIFVDGLAAQGILPGILIGISMPYIFYWSYKYNWTIRLPKQVPQTISQAFLAVIPLFLVLAIYGTVGFALEKICGMPVLFWLFTQIEKGLTNNPALNNSYGLITIYTLMEGGFWFLGVHPEPVHAVMRATFWTANLSANGAGTGNNLFIEPLMYGFGAMGGSGCTLMVPVLCILFGRSQQLKVTGKTACVPIIFQVNEPALFGAPTILNPIFAFPMIFTGMANDLLFKAIADATNFQAGGLNLPWSTPYFLQTTLGSPTQMAPWIFVFISLAICTAFYAPFVIIQDRIYCKEEQNKLGLTANKWHSNNGLDIIKQKLLLIESKTRKIFKEWKLENKGHLTATDIHNKKVELFPQAFENHIKFNEQLLNDKLKKNNLKFNRLVNIYDDSILNQQERIKAKATRALNLSEYQAKIEMLNLIKLNYDSHTQQNKIDAINLKINKINEKIKTKQEKVKLIQSKKISVKMKKDPKVILDEQTLLANYKYALFMNKILVWADKQQKQLNTTIDLAKYSAYSDLNKIKTEYQQKVASSKSQYTNWHNEDQQQLLLGNLPWKLIIQKEEQSSTTSVQQNKEVPTTTLDTNKIFNVLVLCVGAGSSAVVANSITTGLKERGIKNIRVSALAWGSHDSAIKNVDLIIISPQLGIQEKNLKEQVTPLGIKVVATKGVQYIELSKDNAKAAQLVLDELKTK